MSFFRIVYLFSTISINFVKKDDVICTYLKIITSELRNSKELCFNIMEILLHTVVKCDDIWL